jgi:hypothetical protein
VCWRGIAPVLKAEMFVAGFGKSWIRCSEPVRVNREGAEVGRGYLELTGYAEALRIGKR